MTRRCRAPGLLLMAAALPACSLAPPYRAPEAQPAAGDYQEIDGWRQAQPADSRLRGPWWESFGEQDLNELEARVNLQNQDLKAAFAQLAEARAATRIARAAELPTLTAGTAATRSRISPVEPGYNAATGPYNTGLLLDADVSYELDVWGRVRNRVAAARATQQAVAADLAAVELSLHAELARDYFTLRSLDTQIALLEHTVSDYEQALSLTTTLYEGGVGVLGDVDQAKAQLETARTQVADLRLMRAQTEHALAVLTGESASSFKLAPRPLSDAAEPPPIAVDLPSTLLERRPDIAASERRVASANAAIGIARAAYFPVFSLQGLVGLAGSSAQSWLTAPSLIWSLGPQAVLTVLDGGRHRAQTAAARAAYDEEVARYRGTVLTAYQEVEDALAALHQLKEEADSQAAAVEAAAGALEQAQYRFQGGAVTYLEVVVTGNAALAARLSAASIQLRRMLAAIQLVKALGGGWQDPEASAGAAPSRTGG